MAMKKNNRDYIAQMNKGMKQKLSMLLIACLLFTGYHGLTISGRAEQEEKEQTNEISVSGTQVKIQLLGEDIRRAAKEAIEKGDRVEAAALQGYSGDEDLQKEYAEIFSSEKEVYEIPLDSISEGLSESLAEEEAGLQVFVERDAKDLERLVRKESKESLLLYDKNSQLSQLFPKNNQEETKATVEKEEESGAEKALASDSNIEKTERNTELTGSELITFLYKNKADHRISFQLSVDGNTYPKVVVSPKTQLFKSFLDKLKKEEKKPQAETTVVASTEAKESTAVESTETEATASAEETEESESESAASSVSLVSTEGSVEETTVAESTVVETAEAESAEESAETKEHTTEVTEKTEATEETVAESKAAEAVKEKKENFTGFLQEVIEHYEEFLGELQTARFAQYSLNELGRKTQNVEIKDFVTVEVFYDEDAFDEDVVLEAKRLVKPGEEGKEGEKLTEEQIKLMQDTGIYEDTDSLDIRFVSKKDKEKEVEPKENYTVTVRLTFDKKAVPEEATADTIAIHHIVEEDGKEPYVETVLQSEAKKKVEKEELSLSHEIGEAEAELIESGELVSEDEIPNESISSAKENRENITKEFTVSSFSAYIVGWNRKTQENKYGTVRFHFVDSNFRELAPVEYVEGKWLKENKVDYNNYPLPPTIYEYDRSKRNPHSFAAKEIWGGHKVPKYPELTRKFFGYELQGLFGSHKNDHPEQPSYAMRYRVIKLTEGWAEYEIGGIKAGASYFGWTGDGTVDNRGGDNCFRDYYFVYDIKADDACPNKTRNLINPTLLHDKYITKNSKDNYELTLTAQTKKGDRNSIKPKLDVVFVYDNTGNISTADTTETKKAVYGLMDDLDKETDARFALVAMNSEAKPTYNPRLLNKYSDVELNTKNLGNYLKVDQALNGLESSIVGKFGNLNNTLTQNDAIYNDVTTYEFGKKEAIKGKIENLQPNVSGGGANYAAAIADVISLVNVTHVLKDQEYTSSEAKEYDINWKNFQGGNDKRKRDKTLYYSGDGGTVRQDAKVVVVFITGSNPTKAYVPKDGKYDTYIRHNGEYYLTRNNYKKGQSISNDGSKIYYPALDTAKALLRHLHYLDAFYTVGVGDESNWDKIEDFTSVLPIGITKKHFDASNVSDLKKDFDSLPYNIFNAQLNSVSIEDTLSENVELIDGDNSIHGVLAKKQANRVEDEKIIDPRDYPSFGLNRIKAWQTYDDVKKRTVLHLETDPENFVLPDGYELRLVADIKPSKTAYKNINIPSKRQDGDDRTDLNDIYKKEKLGGKEPLDKYGTSAGINGLPTNDFADVKYKYEKPGGGNETPPSEEYNKPIINVEEKGYLQVKKIIWGMNGKIYNQSSGTWTEFGKKILKNISFQIWQKDLSDTRDEEGGTLLTTINLGDSDWIDGSFKDDRIINKNGYNIKIHKYESENGADKFIFTIDDLPKNKNYRVVEIVHNENEVYKEAENALTGYKFVGKGKDGKGKNGERTEKYNPLVSPRPGYTYEFNNLYEPENPEKITVKKIVEEFGGTAYTNEAKNDNFDFDIAFYKRDGLNDIAVSENELIPILNSLRSQYTKKVFNVSFVDHANGSSPSTPTIHFQLHHDESIEIAFNPNYSFRIYERKKEGYDSAKVDTMKGNTKGNIGYQEEKLGSFTYTYTGLTTNQGQTVVFKNPRITVVPTGLRGDLTPYLFSIFGFTLMAGAYFAINQKKRREI